MTQAPQLRGRVSAKVRYGPVQLELDVPEGDVLPAWAIEPHKRQAASVVFFAAAGGQPVETLRLPAAYCVAYQEQFVSGNAQGGAYQCFLTLSDPTGWPLAPGGPAGVFVVPAARSHGVPGTAVLSELRDVAIGGAVAPRTLVDPADVPPHLPAPQPNPSPDYAQVHASQAEWAALIQGRWERNDASKKKKFTFLSAAPQHRISCRRRPFYLSRWGRQQDGGRLRCANAAVLQRHWYAQEVCAHSAYPQR